MISRLKIMRWFFSLLPISMEIIFESNPDFTDNTFALYRRICLDRRFEPYKKVWYVHDSNNIWYLGNRKYIDSNSMIHRIIANYHLCTAKCVITDQTFFPKQKQLQLFIYLTHGVPLKSVKGYHFIPDDIDFCISTSNTASEIMCKELLIPKDKLVALGYPRNDDLFLPCELIIKLKKKYNKIIVWYPTYRQHKAMNHSKIKNGLPLLHDRDNYKRLNDWLYEKNVLLILKPHPAQDLSFWNIFMFENIHIIDDSFFLNNSIYPYQLIGNCDALVTDYSSIYFDFLLCKKPIGLILEDIEEYSQYPGLIENYYRYTAGAELIYGFQDFLTFIERIAKEQDIKKEQRNQIRKQFHVSLAPDNSERVANWLHSILQT